MTYNEIVQYDRILAYNSLRIKRANKIRRLREKRATPAMVAGAGIGAGIGAVAGGAYGAYKGWQRGDAWADQAGIKDDGTWGSWWGRNWRRAAGGLAGLFTGGLAGAGVGAVVGGAVTIPGAGPLLAMGALSQGTTLLKGVADMDQSISNQTMAMKEDAKFNNNRDAYIANVGSKLGKQPSTSNYVSNNYYNRNTDYNFSNKATGYYNTALNSSNLTPSYKPWEPAV